MAFRSRFPFPVHDSDLKRRLQNRFGDGPDRECFSNAGTSHDAEALSRRGPFSQLSTVLALQQGVDMERGRQLNGLTGCAGRGNDDDSASRMRGAAICLEIEWELVIAGWVHN
jgi:hypothetical protein